MNISASWTNIKRMKKELRNSDLPIFIRFLKEKGVYKHFLFETKKNTNEFSTLNSCFGGDINKLMHYFKDATYSILTCSLVWRDTELGYEFWSNLADIEYPSFYKKMKGIDYE